MGWGDQGTDGVLSALSFLLGYENLIENREQSRQNDVQSANDRQAQYLLEELGRKFDEQNKMLTQIMSMLKKGISVGGTGCVACAAKNILGGLCMRIIADLVRFVKDEAKSVKMYGNMAIKLKGENKELADLLWNMANTESSHLDNIHAWLVKYIEKEKKERVEPIPQGMLDVWDWEHEQMIKDMHEYKLVLQSYTKM